MYRLYRNDKLEGEFPSLQQAEQVRDDEILEEQYDFESWAEWERNRAEWRIEFVVPEVMCCECQAKMHGSAYYIACEFHRLRAENEALKDELEGGWEQAWVDRYRASRQRIAELESLLARERGCAECWKGEPCGEDCHMADFRGEGE